jgi:hypothetical protein
MPTPAQEFERLLDRYRDSEGLCAAADDDAATIDGASVQAEPTPDMRAAAQRRECRLQLLRASDGGRRG